MTTASFSKRSLFQVATGISFDGLLNITYGAGNPPVSAGPAGSIYIDSDTSVAYISSGTSWLSIATEAYVSNTVSTINAQTAAGAYWKPPVIVADTTSTSLPTFTAGSSGSIEGVAITNGDSVLFTQIGDIYQYDESTGTFTEESPSGVPGDATYVLEGDNAGKTYVLSEDNGWVLFSQLDVTELGYVQAFIGKPGNGNFMPVYTSTNVVTTGTSLVSGISALDAVVGAKTTDTLTYTTASGTLRSNIAALDVELATVESTASTALTNSNSNTSAISTITSATSGISTITQTAPSGSGVEFVTIDNVTAVKWFIVITDTENNTESLEIMAVRTSGTSIDYTSYGQLGSVPGLSMEITANTNYAIFLDISATNGITVTGVQTVIA